MRGPRGHALPKIRRGKRGFQMTIAIVGVVAAGDREFAAARAWQAPIAPTPNRVVRIREEARLIVTPEKQLHFFFVLIPQHRLTSVRGSFSEWYAFYLFILFLVYCCYYYKKVSFFEWHVYDGFFLLASDNKFLGASVTCMKEVENLLKHCNLGILSVSRILFLYFIDITR